MAEKHRLFGGKLHIYKRNNGKHWHCSTFIKGKNWRTSTKEDSLAHAKEFAEDWYLELKGKSRAKQLNVEQTFAKAAELFLHEYEIITEGERSAVYVETLRIKLRVHLLPFFGDKLVTKIKPGLVQQYRVHRATSRRDPKTGEPLRPARSTIHQEIVALRHVLKTAERHGWLEYIPNFSPPYKTSGKVAHRAWFSPAEYKRLYEATRERAKNPHHPRHREASARLHDFVLFMANTGLRPDEAKQLQFRDVTIIHDEATGERILEIEVRGKRGVGYCKSTPGAVLPFQRLQMRRPGQPTAKLFSKLQREFFNEILSELNLKFDRDGNRRTAYSLRHTYICMRLMEGADIYQVAKNCRTSVEMIEKFYAKHIQNTLDAAAINVTRSKINSYREKTPANDRVADDRHQLSLFQSHAGGRE